MKLLYALGVGYLAICGGAFALELQATPDPGEHGSLETSACTGTRYGSQQARDWYCSVKPSCNALEAPSRLAATPPPAGWDGAGYAAACQALAGRFGDAHATLKTVPRRERANAAAIVFEVGHPVADGGDDAAAGPIMELVLAYWPDNYQAVYHAGMSHHALGRPEEARTHLTRFLTMYHRDDMFTKNAREALDRIGRGLPPARPNPGAH